MNSVTSKLFIKSFETLLKGYNTSYERASDKSMEELKPTIKKDGDNYDIWVEGDTVMSKTLIELVASSVRTLCGGLYYVNYNQTAKRLEIHIF